MKTYYKFLVVVNVNKRSLKDAEQFILKKLSTKKVVVKKIESLGKEKI